MTLETLKDLDFEGKHEGWDFSGTGRELLANKSGYGCAMRIVKQEAIKWITDRLDHVSHHKATGFSTSDCRECIEKESQIDWIKHFFNITDEDLKCSKK